MLEQVEIIFEDMDRTLKNLKKASYKKNMEVFSDRHGHYIREMVDYMESAGDKSQAAEELSAVFCDAVEQQYEVKGKIKPATQADLNMFMIYYVFPTILLTESTEAKLLADTLCTSWRKRFKNSRIGYTNYDKIYESFNEKLFGAF